MLRPVALRVAACSALLLVSASRAAAQDSTRTSRAAAGDSTRRARAEAQRIGAVVVTPGQVTIGSTVGTQATELSREGVARLPKPLDDLFRGLARLPGMSSSDQSARLSLRGASTDETAILLDGMRLRDPFHLKDFDGSFSVLDPELIGGVTVISGGAPLEYGDQLGGVITFTPRVPESRRATTLSAGLTGVRATHLGRTDDRRHQWLLSARRAWLDVVLDASGANEGTNTLVKPTFDDGFLRYQRTVRHGTRGVTTVAANLLTATDAMRFRSDGDPTLTSDYRTTQAWMTGMHIRPTVTASLTLGHTDARQTRVASGAGTTRLVNLADARQLTGWTVRGSAEWTLHSRLQWRGGAEWLPETADASTWRQVGLSPPPRTRAQGGRAGAWSALRWQAAPALFVEGGARVDRWPHLASVSGSPDVAPRLAVAWEPRGGTTVRVAGGALSYGMGAGDRALADADSAWYPVSRARSVALSLDQQLPVGLRLVVGSYARSERGGRPRFVNVSGGLTPVGELESDRQRFDVVGGWAAGTEVSLRREAGPLRWSLAYTTARATDEGVGGVRVRRPWDMRHAVATDLSWTPGRGWLVAVGTLWHSGWPYSRAQIVSYTASRADRGWPRWLDGGTAPYARVDARVSRSWRRGTREWRLFVDAFNALDRRNARGEWTRLQKVSTTWVLTRFPVDLAPRIPTAGVAVTF